MMEGEKVKEVMEIFLKDKKMEAINVEGHLRGLIRSWGPYIICQSKSLYEATLEIELEDPETRTLFSLLNIYGPFHDITK